MVFILLGSTMLVGDIQETFKNPDWVSVLSSPTTEFEFHE